MRKLFVIFKLSLLIIFLTGCGAVATNYIPVNNTEIWIGNSNRNVEVVGEVLAVHYAPSLYSRTATVTAISHDDGQLMLFCMEESYPTGARLTVKGSQSSPRRVLIPSPTGFEEEFYIAICVDEVSVISSNQ